MTKGIGRYSVTFGLAGCYIPDNGPHYVEFNTRRELAKFIRDELDRLEWPKKLFGEVNIRRVWKHIAKHGSSVAHFSIYHQHNVLNFHGLTDAEYAEAEAESECA
jgi:hypothetical protein